VLEEVAFGPERRLAVSPGHIQMDRLLFSAKEAVYKAWFPLAGRWLGFDDAELTIDTDRRAFQARLLVPGPVLDGSPLTRLEGSWCVENGVICTATVIAV
jgi:4'-phosphopantetheinyl transferase EntD